jgi:hypothetical protein
MDGDFDSSGDQGAALMALKNGSNAATLNSMKSGTSRVRMIGGDQGARQKDDFYPTPARGIEALLSVESFDGDIWEPACGDGAISKVLEANGYRVASTDLVDRGYGETRIDFLMEYSPRARNIITNPPFKLAVPFVRKAVELSTGKVAMLLKIAFLEGIERSKLFSSTPLARVWVFSQRLAFVPGDGGRKLDGGGMMAFGWFVWEHGYTGKPTLGWI